MKEGRGDIEAAVVRAVGEYQSGSEFAVLLAEISRVAEGASADELVRIAEGYMNVPEVVGPIYEHVVDKRPDDDRAIVVLAGAYWLTGRGPEVVGELASRALTLNAENRGAWHLWALVESDQRRRMERWMQVSSRFPDDELARANLADNATSLASAENDPVALAVAVNSFETLLATAEHEDQRAAISSALQTLRRWRF